MNAPVRKFETVDQLWSAMLKRSNRDDEYDPFADHEDTFIEGLAGRFGRDTEGEDWEVLVISRSVDAFLINLALSKLNSDLIDYLRGLLLTSLPDDSVLLAIFDPTITDDSRHVGSVAIFKEEAWFTREVMIMEDH